MFDEEEIFNINTAVEFFRFEYKEFDDKVKSGILATATSFLNQFQEFRASQIFCPKENERTIKSMDELIDNGEVLVFDVENESLSRSMGTIIKMHHQRSVLGRISSKKRSKEHPALLFGDEFQGVVTSGGGGALGDDRFFDKCRAANAINVIGTQSFSSLLNTLKSESAVNEFVQNFRTRIAFHSADAKTTNNMKELVGQSDVERESHSVSEIAQKSERNFFLGGFDSKDANISESINVSQQKEWTLTGKEFTALKTFEAWALVFDGVESKLTKLFMKPNFLERPETPHDEVLDKLRGKHVEKHKSPLKRILMFLAGLLLGSQAVAMPNICSVISQPSFASCFSFTVTPAMCGSLPPRPCARISYYVPQTFIETTVGKGLSHFSSLPIAAAQLAGIDNSVPYGAVFDDDSQSFQARTIAVPLTQIAFAGLPCGGERQEKLCFDGMSEHMKTHWATGKGDHMQPAFLAWQASPKLCLLKGAATSVIGGPPVGMSGGSGACSFPIELPVLPPSKMPVCTGWGVMFPRYGTQVGASEMSGSLSIASRIKSLSVEVFKNMPASPDEKWSMLSPNSSACFREFENIGAVETFRLANNRGRISKKNHQGNIFTVWKKVSCKRDWPEVPVYKAEVALLAGICKGLSQ